MNRRKKNEEIRRAARNAQVIHRGNVTLAVMQSTCYNASMLFSLGMSGVLFVPRGHNVARDAADAVEKIQSGALMKYEGTDKTLLVEFLSRLKSRQ